MLIENDEYDVNILKYDAKLMITTFNNILNKLSFMLLNQSY
jgi:hypothetical protein